MPKETQKAALGLRRIKLLDGLSNESLQALSNDCSWRPYKAGQTIISRNSPEHEVYLLVAGKVRVSMYSANGRQVTFRDVECGGKSWVTSPPSTGAGGQPMRWPWRDVAGRGAFGGRVQEAVARASRWWANASCTG